MRKILALLRYSRRVCGDIVGWIFYLWSPRNLQMRVVCVANCFCFVMEDHRLGIFFFIF